jgi:hypothetical protein
MSSKEIHRSETLSIEVEDAGDGVKVVWHGSSTARDPGRFILPILTRALERSSSSDKPVVLDFRSVEYLNSSTITPVIRILEQARRGSARVLLLYRKDLRWQELNFTALEVFRTEDRRIEIRGE